MSQPSVYAIAKSLYLYHDFDPDVAVSAAHCYVKGELPTASYAQAIAHMERVKHVPKLTTEEVLEIEHVYRRVKLGAG